MFDRFTIRAREAFGLARAQAQRLKHPYFGTEHLLLGIVQEGGGVAASIPRHFEVDLNLAIEEVGSRVTEGSSTLDPMARLPFTAAVQAGTLTLVSSDWGSGKPIVGILKLGDGDPDEFPFEVPDPLASAAPR